MQAGKPCNDLTYCILDGQTGLWYKKSVSPLLMNIRGVLNFCFFILPTPSFYIMAPPCGYMIGFVDICARLCMCVC